MNRLGFRHDNLRRTLPALLASPNLVLEAVHTHFGTADEPGSTRCSTSSARASRRRAATLDELGAGPRLRHAANSAALLRDSRVWYDFVRPGLLLYGLVPPPLGVDARAHAGDVADQPRRGREGRARRRERRLRRPLRRRRARRRWRSFPPATPTASIGGSKGRGSVLIRGRRAPIVGAVSMDMLTVDVTDIDARRPGDEVVFLGSQGAEPQQTIDAREMAAWIGTIPYEILCRLGSRVERKYD